LATRTVATAVAGAKAGFWIRVGAYLIDGIIVVVVSSILNSILRLDPIAGANGLGTLIGLVYFVALWSSTGGGQTIGMRILNLKVIRTDGSELTLIQAVIRYVGFIISAIPFCIGLIWVAFDADKQGWHDKIAGTYVVKAT